MDAADILEKAAELIEPEGAWTQGASARSADGKRCLPAASRAACWCASGAIARVAPDWEANAAALKIVNGMLRRKVWVWNDSTRRTQAEVVAKLREAAAKARRP